MAFGRLAAGLPARERAWVHELTYGVFRLRGRLDHLIARKVHGGLERLDAVVLDILRLGAYQLLYMGSVPRYAGVSQAVAQARANAGRGASGLVNAVLRGVGDDGAGSHRFPDPGADPIGYLVSWSSHPQWMVERWLGRWSPEKVKGLLEANNQAPSLNLVPLDRPLDEAARLLEAEGFSSEPVGRGTDCLKLRPGTDPGAALAAVPSIIQDPGANLVVQYADVPPGMKVADLCAAPGGKALALSGGASYVLAADRSEVRMHMVRENATRTGSRIGLAVADACRPPVRKVDVVLLDVPCTGTGTLGRHPDGRWRLAPESVTTLAALQHDLMEASAEVVRPGGLLVYSTCSLEPEENQEQVQAFLARHTEYDLEPPRTMEDPSFLDAWGFLNVFPQDTGFDGAFAARLRRCA